MNFEVLWSLDISNFEFHSIRFVRLDQFWVHVITNIIITYYLIYTNFGGRIRSIKHGKKFYFNVYILGYWSKQLISHFYWAITKLNLAQNILIDKIGKFNKQNKYSKYFSYINLHSKMYEIILKI